MVLGREASGTVLEVGEGVDQLAAFERDAEGRPTDTKIQIRVAGA